MCLGMPYTAILGDFVTDTYKGHLIGWFHQLKNCMLYMYQYINKAGTSEFSEESYLGQAMFMFCSGYV